MRAAECGKKVVERILVRQVHDCKPRRPLRAFTMEQIVQAKPNIEQVPGRNAWRVVIVVFRAIGRNPDTQRTAIRIAA